MDKFMASLMTGIGKAVHTWENLVGLPTSAYQIGKKRFTVNWNMVVLVTAFWLLVGLLDWFVF